MARPIFEAKKQSLSAAIWGSVDRPSISINKRYKDKKTNEWKDSKYYYEDNIREIVALLEECADWLKGQRAAGTAHAVEVLGTTLLVKTTVDDEIPW